ncbi:uncharacterized protein LOC143858426 [Tasmannia lanceolata]|uniref:uncharacterized protein LOC143858426 n=1 Tax=Tasmannia lanceolata TaxID=3420 RepID=UPI004062B4E0
MVAALGRFISKFAERCSPFFNAVKGLKTAPWTEECQAAFEELKQYLSSPPLLTKQEPGEELLLYLSVSPMALAVVLVREEHSQQKPVYYVSKVLYDAEVRYQRFDKLAYSLVMAARKLRSYFQAHTIKVLPDQPLRQVLHKPDTSGRLVKWAIELSEFDIQYIPRPAIKAQVLVDFVAECTIPRQIIEPEIVQTPAAEKAIAIEGQAEDGIEKEIIPIQGVYEARDERMVKYLSHVRQLASKFKSFEVIRIPRTENTKADVLSKLAASGYTTLGSICMEFLQKSSIEGKAAEIMQVEHESCWMDEIIKYLRSGKLPEAKKDARKVTQRAARFSLDDELFLELCVFKWISLNVVGV